MEECVLTGVAIPHMGTASIGPTRFVLVRIERLSASRCSTERRFNVSVVNEVIFEKRLTSLLQPSDGLSPNSFSALR